MMILDLHHESPIQGGPSTATGHPFQSANRILNLQVRSFVDRHPDQFRIIPFHSILDIYIERFVTLQATAESGIRNATRRVQPVSCAPAPAERVMDTNYQMKRS